MAHLKVGAGGDYAGWVELYTFLVTLGALTEDYDCEQISDVTINNNWGPVFPSGINLNGHYVRFYCSWGNSHQGDPTRGFITYCTGALGYFHPYCIASWTGTFYIEFLYFVQTGNNAVSLVSPSAAGLAPPRADIHIYINGVLIKGGPLKAPFGLVFDSSYNNYHVYNVKIWNCNYGLQTTYSGTNLFNRARVVENVTILACDDYGFALGGLPETIYLRNCYACSSGIADWQGGHGVGKTILENCADSDNSIAASLNATETNCLANVDPVVECESTSDTNGDFLNLIKLDAYFHVSGKPRVGSAPLKTKFENDIDVIGGTERLYRGGIVPSLSLTDIAGKSYGEFGYYPIGCHNAQLNNFGNVWEV